MIVVCLSVCLFVCHSVSRIIHERKAKADVDQTLYGMGKVTFGVDSGPDVDMALVFLPRDAMRARSMASCGVRPSVTFVHSVEMNNHIFIIFFTVW